MAAPAAAGAGSGATAQPAGSVTGALPANGVKPEVDADEAADGVTEVDSAGVEVAADGIAELEAGVDVASRLRKAVTSVVVVTMLTMLHPAADFSVRVAARAAGSFAGALAVENSCMRRRVSRSQPARTRWCTSASPGAPSNTNSPSRSASRRCTRSTNASS